MEQICLVLPVKPGQSDDARAFMRELEESRKDEYDRSEQRIGITKEVWHLARLPGGDDGLVDLKRSMDGVPALVDVGVTDFRAGVSVPSPRDAAAEYLSEMVDAFRNTVGRS